MTDTTVLIEDIYAAFNRRDAEAVLSRMTSDVLWPNGWEGGVVVGQAAVRDYWTRQWAQIDPSVTPTKIEAGAGGEVRVEVRQVIRDLAGAVRSDGLIQHVYTFEKGLIAAMEIREIE